MSKSKGNVVNPMDMVFEYGSDALRLGLVASRSAGQNQAFGIPRVVTGRNFCNKLWNIARFIENVLPEGFEIETPEPASLADHWIVHQLDKASKTIASNIEHYRFAEASETAYHAIWDDVADWYIEASKTRPNLQLLAWVLDTSLRIAHPFAPFVTETIWQTLGWHKELLVSSHWPEKLQYDAIAAAEFEQLQALVVEARYVISELPAGKKYRLLYQEDSLIDDNRELISHLARLGEVAKVDQAKGLRLASSNREAWIELDEETLYEHQTNLEVRLADARKDVSALSGRLKNASYVNKAPLHLVEETRQQLADKEALIERLERELEVLS